MYIREQRYISLKVMYYYLESRRDQEEGGELDSQEEARPEEIKSKEVELD